MSIAIRGGHNHGVQGANGIINEVNEDRVIYPLVIKWLRKGNEEVIDVTSGDTKTRAEDLEYGVNKANKANVSYFASIHLNSTIGGYGSEVLYQSEGGRLIAERICAKLASIGFRNRGAKPNTRDLYELKYTHAVANIVECFFLDSESDVALYRSLGADIVAKAIAEGMLGKDINDDVPYPKYLLSTKLVNKVDGNVKLIQSKLGISADGRFGTNTKRAVVAFQSANGLVADGIVGSATWNKLFN